MPRALLVDDDPLICKATARICEDLGIAVDTASDGMMALQRLRATSFDLVVMDISMPRLDGFGVLEAWRAESQSLLPVFMVFTSQADFVGRSRASALGALDFVEKPFNYDEFRRRLGRMAQVLDLEHNLRETEGTLALLQETDGGTGVGSYVALQRMLETEFARARTTGAPLTCLTVTDEAFHARLGGAELAIRRDYLKRLAIDLARGLPRAGRMFHVDDGEFVLLLPGTDFAGARRVVKLITDLEAPGVQLVAVGAASFPHPEIVAASLLYRAANIAMAQARGRPEAPRVAYFEGF